MNGNPVSMEIRCQFIIQNGNPVSVHHSGGNPLFPYHGNPVSVGTKSGVKKSGVSLDEIRCQLARNPVSVHHSHEIRCQLGTKSGVSSSFTRNPVSVGGNPVSGNPLSVGTKSGVSLARNPVSVGTKSGVSSSFTRNPVSVGDEIRCQFIIHTKSGVSWRKSGVAWKSGVGSSFRGKSPFSLP